jgi:hypothetical protein
MRVKLIGVFDEARKSESVARWKQDRRRSIANPLAHICETAHRHSCRHLNAGSPQVSSVKSFEEADDFERTSRGDLCKSGISQRQHHSSRWASAFVLLALQVGNVRAATVGRRSKLTAGSIEGVRHAGVGPHLCVYLSIHYVFGRLERR